MPLREMLLETFVHMPPVNLIDGIAADDAARRPAEGVHSIVEILAHLNFWQSWWLDRCEGHPKPMVAAARHGWPAATADDWPTLVDRFTAGLHRAVMLSEDAAHLDTPITPAIEFPPLAHHTIRDALIHIAQHNAHHLGQVVILRQLAGTWPPPQGSWTW